MLPPTITIVTTTLNHAAGLEMACASVRRQAYPQLQHVIVDAMSRDNTAAVIERYRADAEYAVDVIREPDRGMYEGVNKGLRRATGEVVGILNSGDHYPTGALARVAATFADPAIQVIAGGIRCLDAAGKPGRVWMPDVDGLRQRMSVPHPAVFVRRNVYERIGGFDERYRIAADYDLMLRMRAAGVPIQSVDAVLCDFQEGGMSGTRLWRTARETFAIQRAHLGWTTAGGRYAHRLFELALLRPAVLGFRRLCRRG